MLITCPDLDQDDDDPDPSYADSETITQSELDEEWKLEDYLEREEQEETRKRKEVSFYRLGQVKM